MDQLSSPSTSPPGASQLSESSPVMDLIAEEACHLLHSAGNHVALLHCMDHVDSNDDGQVNVVDGDDDVYVEVLQVDNLDPSQCFASTDTWSDPCQQKEPVCP